MLALFGFSLLSAETSFSAVKRPVKGGRGARNQRTVRVVHRSTAPVVFAPVVREQVIERPVIVRPIVEPVVVESEAPAPIRTRVVNQTIPRSGPEYGLSAGLFSNLPSISSDIWFHKFLGIENTGVKVGFRYAQGKDSDETIRKHLLIFSDGVIDLNSGPGAIYYLAGGLNYLAYTTGQTSGTVGGELYLGVEDGTLAYGSLYAEAGYSAIRTGFSPSQTGLMLNLGFKGAF